MTVPRAFDVGFWVICLLLFVFVALRSWLVPFAHDEVATFYFYIQPGSFIPFKAHPDANGHFLTSALGWICYKVFGSSPFSLRLPSLAGFVLLCYAVRRFWDLLLSKQVRFFFMVSFLGLFTFLAYFSLCRGYGISMACLLMALFYFFSFLGAGQNRHFYKFLFFIQLALAANLTLLFVAALCSLFCVITQIRNKQLFRIRVLAAWALHAGLLIYWVLFAFFLKEQGALYYGEGESYWEVTFHSLFTNVFGDHRKLDLALLAVFAGCGTYLLYKIFRKLPVLNSLSFISFLLLSLLVLTFYLLKKFMGVNYPEDRTGLFFYVFFICTLSFILDEGRFPRWLLTIPLLCVFVFSAGRHIDLNNHPWSIYETMPPRFFDLLLKEQEKSPEPITIAGHRVREFIYGFTNYRSEKKLNHMTSPDFLHMNCDFALAMIPEKPYYNKYYAELAAEDRWGFRLLKRIQPIKRIPVAQSSAPVLFEGEFEYQNCIELKDTVFTEGLPLQADVNFEVLECAKPLKAWFILQVDADNENENIFVRTPLDLIYQDWTKAGQFQVSLVTPNMPKDVKRLVLYIWNIDKKPLKIRVNGWLLRKLEAEGITEVSQAKL